MLVRGPGLLPGEKCLELLELGFLTRLARLGKLLPEFPEDPLEDRQRPSSLEDLLGREAVRGLETIAALCLFGVE